MKTRSFSGLGPSFIAHDACATESQGPIQDRAGEHLVSTDGAIVAARKLLLKAVRDIQDGREPPLVFRDPASNHCPGLIVLSEVLPSATDAKEYVRELAEGGRRKAAGNTETLSLQKNR